jgi:hypothetical protein
MKLSWKIYSFGYALLVILGVAYSLWPDSAPSGYYKILISFDKSFLWQYIFHFISTLLDVLGLLPLFLFVFQKKWFVALFWKIFFFVKILGIFAGNSYEANFLGTVFAVNKLTAIASSLIGLALILPYYIAIYLYAFRRIKT